MMGLVPLEDACALCSPPREDTVRRCPSVSQEAFLTGSWTCWPLHIGLPAFRTVRNKHLWFKPPCLGYLRAAPAHQQW